MRAILRSGRTAMAFAAVIFAAPMTEAAEPPGPTVINGQKVLTLISRDPPALRCNNNIQIAAELSNIYKVPVVVVPVSFAGPGAKAPSVFYGKDLIAEDGDSFNGMVTYNQIADILEIEGVPKQELTGRLTDADVKPLFESLKQRIRQVP